MKTSINWAPRAPRYVSFEEQRKLTEACDRFAGPKGLLWRGIISLGLETAARLGEILDATWGDFDLSSRVWTLRGSKSGKPRVVPLTNEALAALLLLGSASGIPDDPIVSPKGSRDLATMRFRRLARSAGLEDLHFADLRREAIYRMVNIRRLLSDQQIKAIVGHGWNSPLPYDDMRARWRRLSPSRARPQSPVSALDEALAQSVLVNAAKPSARHVGRGSRLGGALPT